MGDMLLASLLCQTVLMMFLPLSLAATPTGGGSTRHVRKEEEEKGQERKFLAPGVEVQRGAPCTYQREGVVKDRRSG